jgi:hypothetical protein
LALFGRRAPERVHGSVMPAAENLHMNGLMHRGLSAIPARYGLMIGTFASLARI